MKETIGRYRLVKQGKVRDIYDGGGSFLIVASDRISAFDYILPSLIPDKGKVLNKISCFWFDFLSDIIDNHKITCVLEEGFSQEEADYLEGRSMLVKKAEVFPFECVVRGYLSGSAWKEYRQKGEVCGIKLPAGLKESQKLPQPIFTPATKAESGHDENVTFEYMKEQIGSPAAEYIRERSLALYNKAYAYAWEKGIIIADTKFEFGRIEGKTILIDEVFTPDSSRFWPRDEYEPGRAQKSFDKQFVRDYLSSSGWDKNSPPPALPQEIIDKTREKYIEVLQKLTGERL